MEINIRPARASEVPELSTLVCESFVALAADAWEAAAVEEFLTGAAPEKLELAIASAFLAVGAWNRERAVGFALMPRASLLGMLFVNHRVVSSGVGRQLWEYARSQVELKAPEVKTVELNSTPYALSAYKALGFYPISHEYRYKGCVATRMACWLTARSMPKNAG